MPAHPDESKPDKLVGQVLADRYRIEGRLGEGGFATVYRAEHRGLERPVAIKVLRDGFAATDELRSRFEREARALASLSHPHIVSLMDYGVAGETPFLVMELLRGVTLKELLAKGTLPAERALGVARQILRGVAYAHEHGVLHRDLKPANVFLQALPDTPDHVKLLDFGFAKFIASEAGTDSRVLTRTGIAFGTPAYMAPEQATHRGADKRADLYAVGVMLFEMLAGRRPFEGDASAQLRAKIVGDGPSLGSVRPDLDVRPELEALLARLLARRPEDRYQSAAEVLAAMDRLPPSPLRVRGRPSLRSAPPSARARLTGVALIVGAVALALLLFVGCVGAAVWMTMRVPTHDDAVELEPAP